MSKVKKFVIFSPPYNEKWGGVVVLHKLCHLLNELGHDAKIYPHYEQFVMDKVNFFHTLKLFFKVELKYLIKKLIKGFETNPHLNTPVIKPSKDYQVDDDCVVIYSEIVLGNPLNAKNVVRWLLHQPGFHYGQIMYNPGELLFKFNSAINDFEFPGSKTSTQELKVIHYPLEHYNLNEVPVEKKGIAYCIRKGKHKKLVHNPTNATLIDNLPHKEVAKILKKSKQFISYDTYTAYSIFAVLCGCESIVIPDEGTSEIEWYPKETDRYGLAYGFDNIEKAKLTAHLVKEHIIQEEKSSLMNVKKSVDEINQFFFDKN
ncbi:WavQ [Litorilituus sediminis]|uniref:WavQ n=1 Tax=Litorilituus sediminis TaxID=718192 RepID=A0A4P6P2E8_9GAMM|nr:WavQ [Litorilituus sediminis]QBG35284.1 WavQ [Litorilituus sediminis]